MTNPDTTLYVMPKFETHSNFFCPFECDEEFNDQNDVKSHFVNCHTFDELKKWGYRKDILQIMIANTMVPKMSSAPNYFGMEGTFVGLHGGTITLQP
jgi:hypothetical protein